MEKWKKRAIDLLTSMAFGVRGDVAVVPYYPQKTRINGHEERFFNRTTPERRGLSSKRIFNMYSELEREVRSNVHTIMVLRGGEVISECSAPGYSSNTWHLSHSMAKTVCGMVIGGLVDEGVLSLNDRIVDIFGDAVYRDKRMALITVEHLLTMTSGIDFAEAGSITDSRWMEAFFFATVKFAPGTKFDYNSMNTYMLACIAERVSGKSFLELVEGRIFAPLGIRNYLWEVGPEGIQKAGWGLYMSAESWAKLGVVMSLGGWFANKRILSEEWVKASTTCKVDASGYNGRFDYSYQMWVQQRGGEFLFNGMLGQNVWVCPKNDIVVVLFSGNNEIFQDSAALGIIRKHLGGEIDDEPDRRDYLRLKEKESSFFNNRRWVNPVERQRGLLTFLGLGSKENASEKWNDIVGRYAFAENNVGMLPLIVRVMQNNFHCCIDEIQIAKSGDKLYLIYRENGESYYLQIGLFEYERNVININGEPYLVMVIGETISLENGGVEYRVELNFVETASVRRIKIVPMRDRIEVSFTEMPNEKVVENLISHYSKTNTLLALGIEIIERRFGRGAIKRLLKERFNPVVVGADMSFPEYEYIVEKERNKAIEEAKKSKAVMTLVERLIKDRGEKDELKPVRDNVKMMKKYFSGIIEKITYKTSPEEQNDN